MKKIILLATAIMMLQSCKTFKLYNKEVVEAKTGYEKIAMENEKLMITTEIEGTPQKLMVDFGASVSVIVDTTIIPNYHSRYKVAYGKARGAGRGKVAMTHIPLKMNDNLYSAANKVFVVVDSKAIGGKNGCSAATITGLYGNDLFAWNDSVVHLEFGKDRIGNLTGAASDSLKATGYEEIKSKFRGKGIDVYLTINGKEYPFLFDTGFTGTLNIPYDSEIAFVAEPHQSFEGVMALVITGKAMGRSDIYEQKVVSMGKIEYPTIVTLSTAVTAQNIGMGLIKGFDWIVDYKNKKMYLRKNTLAINSKIGERKTYNPAVIEGNLIVSSRKVGATDYETGKTITSVNGTEVNDTNKCEMLALLKKTEDWKTLQVIAN